MNNNSCGCNNNSNTYTCNNGILETLQVINILQNNACPETCLNSCDRPVLGGGTNCVTCNTRPIMLYTCSGGSTPLSMPTTRTNAVCSDEAAVCSNVFRVEKVENCCCTCRVLAPNTDTTSVYPYVSTDSIFTISVNCICCLRCLNDTYVECVCCA